MRKFDAIIAVTGLAALGCATPALAAGNSDTTTAVTHSSGHPDTTSVSGPCTATSSNGPVWAYDNLSLRLTATPDGTGKYSVVVTAHGSFDAISNPVTGECYTGTGSVDGWYQLEVTSTVAPDPSNVPSQEPGNVGQGAIVSQLFNGQATSIVGGHYSYTYNRINGGAYTQEG